MPAYRRMNRPAGQRGAYRRHGTKCLFGGRYFFFRGRRAFGDRRLGRRHWGRDCRGSRRFVAFVAACFLVRLARGIVRVRIVHVVRDVLSVVLTQLNGYVFID
jgi:hypothetical protein